MKIMPERTYELPFEPWNEAPIELRPLSRTDYPEGTLGYLHFPEELEGRLRPIEALAGSMPYNRAGTATQELENRGLNSLEQVLLLSEDAFAKIPKRQHSKVEELVYRGMTHSLKHYLVTPHAKLIQSALGEPQGPVDPEVEPELMDCVEDFINRELLPHERFILYQRFGLHDWQPRTLDNVGEEFGGRTKERIRQIESRSLAKVRHPYRSKPIADLSTFPLDSIGRAAGFTYRRDIPRISVGMHERGLPDRITPISKPVRPPSAQRLDSFLEEPYKPGPSERSEEEMVAHVRRLIRQGEPYLVFGDLFPEVSVPYEGMDVVRDMDVHELKLSYHNAEILRKHGFKTLGALADAPRDALRDEAVPNHVIRKVCLHAAKLSAYLGVIIDEL